jgi:hypothetical protein
MRRRTAKNRPHREENRPHSLVIRSLRDCERSRNKVTECRKKSATGCERNWSTFAFIHAKVRNRLTYEKLHKLVYVNYNLRIQNSMDGGSRHDDDDDPFNQLMEVTLVDVSNPIHEWMEHARSTVQPELDEESPDTDAPIPSAMVTATTHPQDLQCRTGLSSF